MPIRPDRTGGILNRSRCTSGSVPIASRCRCQRTNAHSRTPPPATTKTVKENPSGATGESFGSSQPQVLACRVPKTTAPRPAAERIAPTMSSRGLVASRTVSRTKGVIARMPRTITTSPTNTTRQLSSVVAQPPRMGPTAMPTPATPPMIAYAVLRSRPSKFPAISAAIAGSTREAPTPSRIDHPSVRTATVGAAAVSAEPQA